MQSRFLEKRVEILERTMEELDGLPARVGAVEGQISQLRTEMRSEFSAVRTEATAFREEMHREFVAVREEIRKGDEESRTFARVLHEDTIARIAVLAEGQDEQFRVLHENVATFREEMTTRLTAIGAQLTRQSRRRKP